MITSRGKTTRVSRRDFLQTSCIAAAAVAGFPSILRAQDKAGDTPIILGAGDHQYQWIDNWAKLPDGKKFGNTHAVVVLADGRVLIHNASPTGDATCVFDPSGKFITSWGKKYAGGAHGMDLRTENGKEFLYLAPTSMHRVYKTTVDGDELLDLHYPAAARDVKDDHVIADYKGPNKFVPTFVAVPPESVSPDGDFYVTDGYGSSYVHRYDGKGDYLQSWGGLGKDPGKLNCPHGIWCDTRTDGQPMIVVADRSNVRLQWFTLDGKLIKMKTDDLRAPCHFDQRGTDLLVPDLKGRVTLLDGDNKLICHLGDNPDESKRGNNGVKLADTRPGEFCTPHSARFDADGNIFVVEWLPYGRVTKLKKL
jgi:hypothetical protein